MAPHLNVSPSQLCLSRAFPPPFHIYMGLRWLTGLHNIGSSQPNFTASLSSWPAFPPPPPLPFHSALQHCHEIWGKCQVRKCSPCSWCVCVSASRRVFAGTHWGAGPQSVCEGGNALAHSGWLRERETEGAGSWLSIIYLPEQTRVVL